MCLMYTERAVQLLMTRAEAGQDFKQNQVKFNRVFRARNPSGYQEAKTQHDHFFSV